MFLLVSQRNCTASTLPNFAARSNAVHPSLLFSMPSAPADINTRIDDRFPLCDAMCKGVIPSLVTLLTLACIAHKNCTTIEWLFWQAACTGLAEQPHNSQVSLPRCSEKRCCSRELWRINR